MHQSADETTESNAQDRNKEGVLCRVTTLPRNDAMADPPGRVSSMRPDSCFLYLLIEVSSIQISEMSLKEQQLGMLPRPPVF